jgi:hypothetical protein
VTFIGDAMAAVVQGVEEVRTLIGQPPAVVGLRLECGTVFPWAHFEAFPEAPVKVSDVLEAAGPGDAGNRFLGINEIL